MRFIESLAPIAPLFSVCFRMAQKDSSLSLYDRIVAVILAIPPGRVATYGTVAKLAGHPRAARTVSYVLHSSSKKLKLPWQRVVGSAGKGLAKISLPKESGGDRQMRLLKQEGVMFSDGGRIDLRTYGWNGKNPQGG